MKKTALFILCASLMALASTSCQKEELAKQVDHSWKAPGDWSPNAFSASFKSDNSKTGLESDYRITWREGDQIRIQGGGQTVNYNVTEINSDRTEAKFSVPQGSTEVTSGPYVATYPTTFDSNTITLPQVQQYDANKNLVDFPMYASSNDRNLEFHNMCGVLELSLQKSNIYIQQIFITTDQPITGNFTIGTEDGVKCIKSSDANGNNNYSVMLNCLTNNNAGRAVGVSINTEKKFYIYLPVATFTSKFDIEIVTTNNATYTLHKADATTAMPFQRNRVKKVSLTNMTFKQAPTLGGYGLYSVAPDQRVYFAHGNLYFKLTNSNQQTSWNGTTYYSGTWGFYEEQYGGWHMGAQFDEFIPSTTGTNAGTYSYTANGQTNTYRQTNNVNDRYSYFTWGYNRSLNTTYNSQPNAEFNATSNKPNTDWVEWGSQSSIYNRVGQNWRTLTRDQWYYLLHTRTMFFGAPRYVRVKLMGVDKLSDDTNPRHTGTTVNVKGLLFYPDRYPTDDPTNHPFFADNVNQWREISKDNWEKMEKAGCVFLPATGYRMGELIYAVGYSSDMFGLYQSQSKLANGDPNYSTRSNTHTAGILWGVNATSHSYPTLIGDLSNSCAHNVRLVMYENDGQTVTSSPEYPII